MLSPAQAAPIWVDTPQLAAPQPPAQQEKVNVNPIYAVLGLVAILCILIAVLTASSNGALSGMKPAPTLAPAAHSDHDAALNAALEKKMETIQGNLTKIQSGVEVVQHNLYGKKVVSDDSRKYKLLADKMDQAYNAWMATVTPLVTSLKVQKPPDGNGNPCANKKPAEGAGYDNLACTEATVNEQAAADVSSPFTGTKDTGNRVPITNAYWKAGLCPVNVHWHLGAEHRSNGQYDENGKGPADSPTYGNRMGLRCNKCNDKDEKFTKPYDCKPMVVGETYEVRWPHSAGGACGTVNQYQTPF